VKVGDLIRFKRTGVIALISESSCLPPMLSDDFVWVLYNDRQGRGILRGSFRVETLRRTAEVINESR
jgi:hypothetical protein